MTKQTATNPEPDYDALLAKVIALAARDGVEDLHTAGAFSDRQTPSLNRCLRNQVYELVIAWDRQSSRRHDPFTAYIDDLAHGHKGIHGTAALKGAVARAVDDFAAAETIDADTASQLREAATKGAVEAYKTVRRSFYSPTPEKQDDQAVESWLTRIPAYWEAPQVSPAFQELLDNTVS